VRIRTGETDNARHAGGRLMAPGVDAGDTAWMLAATALVLLMTPALGSSTPGWCAQEHAEHVHDVRRRAGGGDDHVGADRVLVRVLEGNGFIGGFGYAFLDGVAFAPRAGTKIPHLLFFAFQATFCIVTTALVSGAVVERMRFGPFLVFAALWSVLVYGVLAHWAFGGGLAAGGRGRWTSPGGIPVEMGSGFSALAAALVVGRAAQTTGARRCLRTTRCSCCSGAGLLWFGWFGFNGGAASRPATRACSRSSTRC
jgi:Amt family ammonium transporter